MIRPAIATLPVAACLLAATVAWEFGAFSARQPARVLLRPIQITALQTAAPDHTAEWVSTILARPLFSPDRRAAPLPTAITGGRDAPPGLPRLTGVLVGPFGRTAIFATGGGKPLVVTEGGKVDAWTVQSISIGTVRIRGPDGAKTLQPSFESSPASTTGSAPAGQQIGLSSRR
ncbi:MAG TPA: hypothetical protein VMU81_01055 [Acetobacteraceae bacterium]|nr:hypothetical protein [Acetobacteraceae bacterium]